MGHKGSFNCRLDEPCEAEDAHLRYRFFGTMGQVVAITTVWSTRSHIKATVSGSNTKGEQCLGCLCTAKCTVGAVREHVTISHGLHRTPGRVWQPTSLSSMWTLRAAQRDDSPVKPRIHRSAIVRVRQEPGLGVITYSFCFSRRFRPLSLIRHFLPQ